MKKEKNIKSILLHSFLYILIVVSFVNVYFAYKRSTKETKIISFQTGWTVETKDAVYENVDLTELSFKTASYGDKIVLTNTIPEGIFSRSSLAFDVNYSATSIYVDNTLVYEYGYDLIKSGDILGYGKQFISLPDNCSGKEIRIVSYISENDQVASFAVPTIYDETTMLSDYMAPKAVSFAISIALIVAGFSVTLITLCLYFRSYRMERLICIGIFAFCVGCWSLCSSGLTIFFTNSLVVKIYIEYISLYLSPLPILLYFREDIENRGNKIESFLFYALFFVGAQLLIITVAVQTLGVLHFPVFLKVYQTYMLVCCAFILMLIIKDITASKHHLILFIGVMVILLIVVRDIIMFNIVKYGLFGYTIDSYKSYVSIGSLIFILSLIVDFIGAMKTQVVLATENEFLAKIAYMDVLTGLFSRRRCEEYFEEIEDSGDDFAIIQFDLNNLKTTNDYLGHEKGDELLLRFANILRRTYVGDEISGRMGGDEFIVIIPRDNNYDIEDSIKRLEENINKENELHPDLEISVSIGYCRSSEIPDAIPRTIYIEADKRMYENKRRYHEIHGGRRRTDKTY